MFPKVITGNRAQKMGELGRTPEQEAQTSEEKGLCRGNTEEEGAVGSRVYFPEGIFPPRPLLWPVMLSPGWYMLTENPLLSLTHTLRFAETSSSPYSLEGMVGRTRNSKDWAT